MFSESPYIKALAFSKHHILSVNNLVFVRIRSRPRDQNYSVPEKFCRSEQFRRGFSQVRS